MLHVDMRTGVCRENDVTRDDQIFGRIGPTLEAEARGDFAFIHDGADGHGMILAMIHER